MITLGVVVPGLLALHTAYCLAVGSVLCFRGGNGFEKCNLVWADDSVRFTFWLAFQTAVAVGAFSWFFLANRLRWERYAETGVLGACVILVAGIVLSILYAVW
ncbi:hypothetical protein [Botrimarina colliarenosi]|uniref:hypothetical protein n=1 Tax=Botrimarina colliarenosi TaxID=2528001 RepID=UPI0011B4A4AF|nr:hypothetical protein [Botrimarina colliarenosi]